MKQVCVFCLKEIEPEEFTTGLARPMRDPKGNMVFAHTRHHGVNKERDEQIGMKNAS